MEHYLLKQTAFLLFLVSAGSRLPALPPRHPWVKPVGFLQQGLPFGGAPRARWWLTGEGALLCGMQPNAVFATATAAKYLIISNECLRAAGSGTVLWTQKRKSFTMKILLSASPEWLC